jgi:hypothetical protein
MNKLNIDKLKKFQAAVNRCSRSTPLEGGLYGSNCERTIFVGRWSYHNLANRCFKLKIKGRFYYAIFLAYTSTRSSSKGVEDYKSVHGGFEYHLGWNLNKYDFIFRDERFEVVELEVHFNDLIELEYEEITQEKYYDIVKLFSA